jgi:hypothetical protein
MIRGGTEYLDQGKICEFVMLGRPVAVFADHFPARGGMVEDIGRSQAAAGAADHVEVDDCIFTVVGELGQGKAKDRSLPGGYLSPLFPSFTIVLSSLAGTAG